MKGSSVAGKNPPMKLPKGPKPTTVGGTGFKMPGSKNAKVAPNQNLHIKGKKVSNDGVYQDMARKIHEQRGGPLMKRLLK